MDKVKAEEWNADRPAVGAACGGLSTEVQAELH